MYINKDSLKINNILIGDYITSVKYQYNKLWASDSGRNLAGTMTGTLIGIFPKIVVEFKPLTKTELELIAPILDSATQTVKYYDPYKKAETTMTTYTGDWSVDNNNIAENQGFSCSFISTKKRK